MDVVITHGRKIVSDEVRALTEEKVRHIGEHCLALDRAEVHFSEEHNPRISDRECCEVVMSGHGHTLRARAAGHSPLAAVDLVIDKIEHQVERTKGRIVGRSQPRHRTATPEALFRKVRTA